MRAGRQFALVLADQDPHWPTQRGAARTVRRSDRQLDVIARGGAYRGAWLGVRLPFAPGRRHIVEAV